MAPNRYYTSDAMPTTLAVSLSAVTSGTIGSVQVNSITGYPVSYPFTLLVDWGTSSQEVVTVTQAATGTGPYTYAYGGVTPSNPGGVNGGYDMPYANENVLGGYYSYTLGSLNVVPEVQYVYAKVDHSLGIDKTTSNTGAALFGTYAFGTSPYSVGAWAEYDKNKGAYGWFIGPNVEAEGLAVSPTWQYKDLFARATAGYLHLSSGSAYGDSGTGKNQVNATLEAGLLF